MENKMKETIERTFSVFVEFLLISTFVSMAIWGCDLLNG